MKRTALLLMILTWIANLQANTYDSTYIKDPYFQKLLKTSSQVPIFYNEQVRKQIGNYLKNLNNSTSILIGKTQYYQQLYGPYFDQAGIPKQLFLASAAFCNSDPLFVDPDGGSGMWSMSYAIAKKYKLIKTLLILRQHLLFKSIHQLINQIRLITMQQINRSQFFLLNIL